MVKTRNEIADSVYKMLRYEFDFEPDQLHDDTLLADLNLDSIDRVELSIDIEEEFGLWILDEVYMGWKTVGEVVDYINVALSLR